MPLETKEQRLKALWEVYAQIKDVQEAHASELNSLRASRSVDMTDILILAERIAPSVFAPQGWVEGMPLLNAFVPAPQPEQMRIGKLFSFNLSKDSVSSSSGAVEERFVKDPRLQRLKERLKAVRPSDQPSRMEEVEEEPNSSPQNITTAKPQQTEEENKLLSNNRRVDVSFFAESDEEDEEEG
jgi:hypothetical protein